MSVLHELVDRFRGTHTPAPAVPRIVSKTIEVYGNPIVIFGYEGEHYFDRAHLHAANNPMLNMTLAELPPGSVVIDGGANIGVMTVSASLAGRQLGRIIAIEPSPKALTCLARTVHHNGLDHLVTIVPLALSDKETSLLLMEDEHLAGSYIIDNWRNPRSLGTVTPVSTTTLDILASQLALTRVDLIKLDIECFEPEALRGAVRTIQQFNPVFVMEFCGFNICTQRRTSPVFFLEQILEAFHSFEYLNADNKLQTVSTDEEAYTFLEHNMWKSVVDDIRFRGGI